MSECVDGLRDLVDGFSLLVCPFSPLVSVDGTEFAGIFVGPFVPDVDVMFLKFFDVGTSSEEPEEFVNDSFEEDFFCGE